MTHNGVFSSRGEIRARQHFITIIGYHTDLNSDMHRHELPAVMNGLNLLDDSVVQQLCDFLERGTATTRPFDQHRMGVCAVEICAQLATRSTDDFVLWFRRMDRHYDDLLLFARENDVSVSAVLQNINALDQSNDHEARPLTPQHEATLLMTMLSVPKEVFGAMHLNRN